MALGEWRYEEGTLKRDVTLERALTWRQVASIAEGGSVDLAEPARERIRGARRLVEAIVAQGIRGYGVNTGVGALSDVLVDRSQQRQLSRNIVMSHAIGVGSLLGAPETRAIIAAAINNFSHGYSGLRLAVVDGLVGFLAQDCVPEVPAGGSVGYLTHMAHVSLALLGEGFVVLKGTRLSASAALQAMDLAPLVLEAKEGLSLVNGTPCATGLGSLALQRVDRLLGWADVIAAMTFENLRGQLAAFDPFVLSLRASPGVVQVGERIRAVLKDSALLGQSAGACTQDPLSLRAIPQVHGAVRDQFESAASVVDRELAAVTDNPLVSGTPESPRVHSEAHAVGAAIGLSADSLAIAVAELAAMSERRIDRLLNPLASRLPAFLAVQGGVNSGFMIAQYTAVGLVAENRRLAAPASVDGGITSGLQEDHLSHATPAAIKLLKIIEHAETIFAIELMAATQAYELQESALASAAFTKNIYSQVRARVPQYRDDRPLAQDLARVRELLLEGVA